MVIVIHGSGASSMLMHVYSSSNINNVKHEVGILKGSNIEVPKSGLHHIRK